MAFTVLSISSVLSFIIVCVLSAMVLSTLCCDSLFLFLASLMPFCIVCLISSSAAFIILKFRPFLRTSICVLISSIVLSIIMFCIIHCMVSIFVHTRFVVSSRCVAHSSMIVSTGISFSAWFSSCLPSISSPTFIQKVRCAPAPFPIHWTFWYSVFCVSAVTLSFMQLLSFTPNLDALSLSSSAGAYPLISKSSSRWLKSSWLMYHSSTLSAISSSAEFCTTVLSPVLVPASCVSASSLLSPSFLASRLLGS